VERICEDANLTKGAFFHHFPDKDAAVVAAVTDFAGRLGAAFADAPFTQLDDPLDRVYAYVDFTIDVVCPSLLRDGCLVGHMAQERGRAPGAIRSLCASVFDEWASRFQEMLDAACADRRGKDRTQSRQLALHFIATLEGALMLARVSGDSRVVAESLGHFKRYLVSVFEPEATSSRRRGRRTRRRPS
jgi:TetR/AcrR family transcriptional repressor of nem operon